MSLTIIEPTFVNFLHQSSPENKRMYNQIKNLLLSYENMISNIELYYEHFQINNELQFNLCFVGNYIQVKYNKVTYNIDVTNEIASEHLEIVTKTIIAVTGVISLYLVSGKLFELKEKEDE